MAQIPQRPSPERLVNNLSREFPQFLSQQEQASLEQELQNFSMQTSNQICIVIVDDFNGLDDASFAVGVLNSWGIGQKGKNNGIVILVKPTGNSNQRRLFISVGYGLEGAITDLQTKHIRENDIVPFFKQNRYYEGLQAGCQSLMSAAKGEYNEQSVSRNSNNTFVSKHPFLVFIIIIVIIFIVFKTGGNGRGGGMTYFGGGSSFGGFGGRSGGGSSFGGFGGGMGGGGGSGGSW